MSENLSREDAREILAIVLSLTQALRDAVGSRNDLTREFHLHAYRKLEGLASNKLRSLSQPQSLGKQPE